MSEESICQAALALADEQQREAWLDQVCTGDALLRQRIRERLRQGAGDSGGVSATAGAEAAVPPSQATADWFVLSDTPGTRIEDAPRSNQPTPRPDTRPDTVMPRNRPAREELGDCIGPYRLVRALGEGGMGAVYVAVQEEPVRRQVALKLIRPGLDSAQIIARFALERQTLALMDHPGIAKVLDAGATPDGRPFFVMEMVQGVPITQHCDQYRLTVRERLELFVKVCQALQHAHQKAIIHRDIKPGNVLVGMVDGKAIPKVIDFGIAKALHQQLDNSVLTEFGAVVGTPEYMSPEQADFQHLDVDTRSDIYALGVLLYVLLTGTTPLHRERGGKPSLLELLRAVREEEPPPPSVRLRHDPHLAETAAAHQTEPTTLVRQVHGDLDWIVMKCLEKDRDRRYETANALALDLERHLRDEPVLAGPPTTGYRLRKFIRRHKVQVVAAALVLLALVGGIIGTTLGLLHAREQWNEAEQARQREQRQRTRAQELEGLAQQRMREALQQQTRADEEAAVARAISDFLQTDLLQMTGGAHQADSGLLANPNLTLREALNRAAAALGDRFQNQPEVEAALRETIGQSYRGLSESQLAIPHLRRARDLWQERHGPDHRHVLEASVALANAYREAGQFDQAIPLMEELLPRCQRLRGPEDALTLEHLNNLALAYQQVGQLARAVPLFEQAAAGLTRVKGVDDSTTLICQSNLAIAYHDAGQPAKALPLLEQTMARRTAVFGADHPLTLSGMNNLAQWYMDAGQHPKAITLFEETLAKMRARLGPHHRHTLHVLNNLGNAFMVTARPQLARPLLEEAVTLTTAHLGPDHPLTLTATHNLAMCCQAQGQFARALTLCEQTLAARRKLFAPGHVDITQSLGRLISISLVAGKPEKALAVLPDFLERQRQRFGTDTIRTARMESALATDLIKAGQHAAAEPLLHHCLAIHRKLEPDSLSLAYVEFLLGEAYLGQQKHADAEPLLHRGYAGFQRHAAEFNPPKLSIILQQRSLESLIRLYEAVGKTEEAAKWRKEAAALKTAAGGTQR